MSAANFPQSGYFTDPFCDSQANEAHTLRDYTLTVSGEIVVGYESIKFPAMGRQILAHEMGHMLSRDFQIGAFNAESTAAFIKARECLAQKHTGDQPPVSLRVNEVKAFQRAFLPRKIGPT